MNSIQNTPTMKTNKKILNLEILSKNKSRQIDAVSKLNCVKICAHSCELIINYFVIIHIQIFS